MIRSSLSVSARLVPVLAVFLSLSLQVGCTEKVEQAPTEAGKSVEESLVKSKTRGPVKVKHEAGPAARKGGEG